MQNGQIIRRGKSWLLRYWRDESREGKVVRRRVCKKIAPYCDEYRTVKSLRPLVAGILFPLNTGRLQPESAQTLQQFMESSYLSHVREHKRPSTLKGYTDIFEDHVKQHVAGIHLSDFRTVDGQRLLDTIANTTELSHRSLIHIKSFLSGVFSFAKRTGVFDGVNPMQGTAVPKGRPSVPTYAYSLPEIEKIISALQDDTLRTAVTVAAFTGLSLSELRGLRWDAILEHQINVNRTYWRWYEGETKTQARSAPVPLLPIVASALSSHRERNPGTTFVFEGPYQRPFDLATLGTKRIRPALEGSGVGWHGWHSFRRGLATNLHELGIQDITIQAILRHSSVAVTQAYYIKALPAASVDAMKRLEKKVLGSKWAARGTRKHRK